MIGTLYVVMVQCVRRGYSSVLLLCLRLFICCLLFVLVDRVYYCVLCEFVPYMCCISFGIMIVVVDFVLLPSSSLSDVAMMRSLAAGLHV